MNFLQKGLLLSAAAVLSVSLPDYGLSAAGVKKEKASKPIVVVYENDVHCAIDQYPKFAGLRDAIVRADTADVFTVSSGDYIQGGFAGSVSKGEYVMDVVKSVKYDAMILGNHEFDYGFPRMQELMMRYEIPVTCANLTRVGEVSSIFPQYIMKSSGRHKIAFVGVTTPSTMLSDSYSFFDGEGNQLYDLHEENTSELVQEAVNKARKEGADIVILLTHLGEEPDSKTNVSSHSVVAETRGVDVVLDAHSHNVIPGEWLRNADGDSVLITQSGTKMNNIGKLIIHADARTRGERFRTELVSSKDMSSGDYPCVEVQHALDSVKALVSAREQEVIGYTEWPLPIDNDSIVEAVRVVEVGIGDLVADAFRYVGKTDIGLSNAGGIRTGINVAGDITYRAIIDVAPYVNDICTAEVTGQTLIDGLAESVKAMPRGSGSFLQVSGLRYTINLGTTNTVSDVEVERKDAEGNVTWEKVTPDGVYTVTSTDYVLYKGRESQAFRRGKVLNDGVMLYSEALIKYIQQFPGGRIPEYYRTTHGRIKLK